MHASAPGSIPSAPVPPDRPLAVLVVEDSEDDAELLLRDLRRGGRTLEGRRVDRSESLRMALAEREWDVVLSDFSLPALDGISAFEILREHQPDVPFILVSGSIGEEAAADAMRKGVADFVSKGSLSRLWPVVER